MARDGMRPAIEARPDLDTGRQEDVRAHELVRGGQADKSVQGQALLLQLALNGRSPVVIAEVDHQDRHFTGDALQSGQAGLAVEVRAAPGATGLDAAGWASLNSMVGRLARSKGWRTLLVQEKQNSF